MDNVDQLLNEARGFCDPSTGEVLQRIPEELMQKLGTKQLILELHERLQEIPSALTSHNLELASDGHHLIYTYDTHGQRTGITALRRQQNKGRSI